MMEIQLKKAGLVLLHLLHNRKGETQERLVAGPESLREDPCWPLSLHGGPPRSYIPNRSLNRF